MTKDYALPKKYASATIHFLYGCSKPSNPSSVVAYLKEKKYATIADLIGEGLAKDQIEAEVRDGEIKVAPVFQKRITDLFWLPESESELEKLAKQTQVLCGGDGTDGNAPAMGDVVSVGAELGSQQIALVALAYAAHKGYVKETQIDRGIGVGPCFVSTENPLATIIS
jgi:hypothetical protein